MNDDWPDFNDMWDYNDPAGSEAKFRDMLPSAEESGGSAYHLQLLTQIARALGLQKNFDEAHTLLNEVEESMEGGDLVEVRYLLERGRAFNSSKQLKKAVPLFLQAAEIGEQIGAEFYAVDALHMLAIAAPPEERLDWNLKAIRFSEGSLDERAKNWLGSLYNNTGWSLFDEKRYEEALELFKKAQSYRETQGNAENISIARWCVGKTLRVMERVEAALDIQRELEAGPDHDGFVDEEIAECLYALGQAEEAKPYFKKAFASLPKIDWVAEDAARIDRLKSLSG
jgi:tetratricopeptide (TPR) repeat protein